MAYYCGECIVWLGSSNVNRYGERWCPYSRKYEKADQNTYGCRGFVYVGRCVITKICETLKLSPDPWFEAFDEVRNHYVVPCQKNKLFVYCQIGPLLADAMDENPKGKSIAKEMMTNYLMSAKQLCSEKRYAEAFQVYQDMIEALRKVPKNREG